MIGIAVTDMVGVALSLSIIGGAYLIQRYREDSADSRLHQGRIESFLSKRRSAE